MNIVTLDLDKIDDSDRLRPVDPVYVSILTESIAENGQLEPIEVGAANKQGIHRLTIGAHRVAAMRLLEKTTIQAIVYDVSPAEALMREIDENLCRHDLNELDRAIFLGRRKEVHDRLHPQAKFQISDENQGVAKMAAVLRFTLEASRQTKLAERTIRRLVHRYDHLDPPVRDRLRGTYLATMGSELDAIARLSPDHQMKVVDLLLRDDDPQPNVAAAVIAVRGMRTKPRTDSDVELSRLMSAWKKAGREARQQFREYLAAPVSRKSGA